METTHIYVLLSSSSYFISAANGGQLPHIVWNYYLNYYLPDQLNTLILVVVVSWVRLQGINRHNTGTVLFCTVPHRTVLVHYNNGKRIWCDLPIN